MAHEKGNRFLAFVGTRWSSMHDRLHSKWKCSDRSLLSDAIGEAALRVRDSIVRRDLDLKDPELYFLRSARTIYVRMQNKERRLHGVDRETEEDETPGHDTQGEDGGL